MEGGSEGERREMYIGKEGEGGKRGREGGRERRKYYCENFEYTNFLDFNKKFAFDILKVACIVSVCLPLPLSPSPSLTVS